MTSERLRMGVRRALGAGFMGSLHARVWSQLPNTRLVAVADPDAEACKGLGSGPEGGRTFPIPNARRSDPHDE